MIDENTALVVQVLQQQAAQVKADHEDASYDESLVAYLIQVIESMVEMDAIERADLKPFLEDIYAAELTGDQNSAIVDQIIAVLGLDAHSAVPDAVVAAEGTTLRAPVCAAEDEEEVFNQDNIGSSHSASLRNTNDDLVVADGKPTAREKRQRKRREKKAQKSPKTQAKGPVEVAPESNQEAGGRNDAAADDDDDMKWQTKRFERFHKTWTGHKQWQVQNHAATLNVDELDDDDYSTAWLECLRLGIPWGGRGAGGRGVMRVTGQVRDVHIPNVTMARGNRQLLQNSTLKLAEAKRYGLIGSNGVGKTTLLRRIATGTLPGFPPWLSVQHIQQELPGTEDTALEYALRFDYDRARLLAQEEELLEGDQDNQQVAEKIAHIHERLDAIDAWTAEERATEILKDLGFTDEMVNTKTNALSGGWRMRVSLAGALLMRPDILVLDEPTNHLDLGAIIWLQDYLVHCNRTVLFVTHDRHFLNEVATDIIHFRSKQLHYFHGNYDEYVEMRQQKHEGVVKKLQAREKQRQHMQDFVDKQRAAAKSKKAKGGDQKKQQQINSRVVRMERLSKYREDGKKFKVSYCMFDQLAVDADEAEPVLKLPVCHGLSGHGPLVQLNSVSFAYSPTAPVLLRDMDLQLFPKSRVGVLGNNGMGKSTLVKLLVGKLAPVSGNVVVQPQLRIGYFAQEAVEDLDKTKTPVELFLEKFPKATMLDARQHFGSVGLKDDVVLQTCGTLSGGQRSRVVLGCETFLKPHMLILDEPTNHLDMGTISQLSSCMKEYKGCIVVISHDLAFVSASCNELWAVRDRTVSPLFKWIDSEDDEQNNDRMSESLGSFVAQLMSEMKH